MAIRLQLIVWDPKLVEARASALRTEGYDVASETPDGPEFLRAIRANPPGVFVIDLDRAPATGRDIGLALRKTLATRNIPLVFVGGAEGKAAGVRTKLPDAFFAEWKDANGTIARALRFKNPRPVVPKSALAGYEGVPLIRKLAIKPGSTVVYQWVPEGFIDSLGELPDGVTIKTGVRGEFDKALWFVKSTQDLEREIDIMATRAGRSLWIFWPKTASGVRSGVTAPIIRAVAKRAGLTDYKICAVDDMWSGMLFSNAPSTAAPPKRGPKPLRSRRMAE